MYAGSGSTASKRMVAKAVEAPSWLVASPAKSPGLGASWRTLSRSSPSKGSPAKVTGRARRKTGSQGAVTPIKQPIRRRTAHFAAASLSFEDQLAAAEAVDDKETPTKRRGRVAAAPRARRRDAALDSGESSDDEQPAPRAASPSLDTTASVSGPATPPSRVAGRRWGRAAASSAPNGAARQATSSEAATPAGSKGSRTLQPAHAVKKHTVVAAAAPARTQGKTAAAGPAARRSAGPRRAAAAAVQAPGRRRATAFRSVAPTGRPGKRARCSGAGGDEEGLLDALEAAALPQADMSSSDEDDDDDDDDDDEDEDDGEAEEDGDHDKDDGGGSDHEAGDEGRPGRGGRPAGRSGAAAARSRRSAERAPTKPSGPSRGADGAASAARSAKRPRQASTAAPPAPRAAGSASRPWTLPGTFFELGRGSSSASSALARATSRSIALDNPAFASLAAAPAPEAASARAMVEDAERRGVAPCRAARAALLRLHRSSFPVWRALLLHGASLALHGLGSKRDLATAFLAWAAPDDPVVVLNGHLPTASLRSLGQAICADVLRCKAPTGSAADICEFVARAFAGAHDSDSDSAEPAVRDAGGVTPASSLSTATPPPSSSSSSSPSSVSPEAPSSTPRRRPSRRAAVRASSALRSPGHAAASTSSSSAAAAARVTAAAGIRDDHHSHPTGRRVWVLVHGADGPAVRTPQAAAALGALASSPGVMVVATMDHVNAACLTDQRGRLRAGWAWIDATTLAPLTSETARHAAAASAAGPTSERALLFVLRSLTPHHRAVLRLLAARLAGPEAADEGGCGFEDLLADCLDEMVVSSAASLRTHLVELVDHDLASYRRGASGGDVLVIPGGKSRVALLARGEEAVQELGAADGDDEDGGARSGEPVEARATSGRVGEEVSFEAGGTAALELFGDDEEALAELDGAAMALDFDGML